MANRSGPSMLKRQKELVRRQRQQDKMERRKASRQPGSEPETESGGIAVDEDPDIAGIVPGPQAPEPEWLEERRRLKE
jgi:hypothetical protein